MKRLDKLIIGELIGPFLIGVAMFGSLLLAATYLGRIANYVVQGVPVALIGKITLMLLPPILVKTFTMSSLLGALLAFGRLSGDSEVVAMRAAGASMTRIIRPVGIFSLVIAVISFVINDTLVPNAQKQALSITAQVSDSLAKKASQPIYRPILENNRVVATVSALDFNLADRTLSRATIVSYDEQLNPVATLHAARLKFENPKDWRIDGTAVLLSTDGGTRTELTGGAWPQAIPNPADSPEEMSAQSVNDPDYFTTGELREQLSRSKIDKSLTPEMVRNREYWLWNKFAVPAAAFVFGILGAGLGIRSHRAGTATGFALAIGILFAYMFLANFLNVWAMGGIMPPYVASFTPIILAFVAAVLIIWRRNRG